MHVQTEWSAVDDHIYHIDDDDIIDEDDDDVSLDDHEVEYEVIALYFPLLFVSSMLI